MGQACGCIKVEQSTIVVTERFGKYDGVLQPGCHCTPWYLGYQVAGAPSLQPRQLNVHCNKKTRDNVPVSVVVSIHYRVREEQAYDASYKLSNLKQYIQDKALDAINSRIPVMLLNSLFEQKSELAKVMEEELGKVMSTYGYEIIRTRIVDIQPFDKNKSAITQKSVGAMVRVATKDKVEAEKILQVKRAEGEAEAAHLLEVGLARRCKAVGDGLADSVLGLSKKLPAAAKLRFNFSSRQL